jgi:prolyl-tRNA editing enzyme YbaK/EbsC (Cys-tRNA(Pro) deacylase)
LDGEAETDDAVVKIRSEEAVQAALDRSGLGLRIVRLGQSARSSRDAARSLGCAPEAVVKSLVLRGTRSGKAYLAEVSGSHRADLDLLSRAAGEEVALADPCFVFTQTGYRVGGVAPVGLRNRIEVFIDEALASQPEVWASAGSERAMFRLTPAQLIELTGGRIIRLSNPE